MPASAAPVLQVRVRLFASLREAMGWSERRVVPAPGVPTPLALWDQLGLGPGGPAAAPPSGIRVAINQRFAAWDTPLASGDELAFLPPISGG
ncbi:MAG: MoaD/ThiS family protein [Cyanobacteriota bacterium]